LATISREDKLKLSAEAEYGHAFCQGLFAKLYEQSLWRFIHQVRHLKPMLERVKGGGPVIYGGLPIKSFEILLAEGRLTNAESTEYGWRWPWPDSDEPELAYEQWREQVLAGQEAPTKAAKRNILAELAAFNLGIHTPVETMSAVQDWQNFLRNREGVE